MNVLATAQINAAINLIVVEPGDIVKYYDSNKPKYTQLRVKAIYIAFNDDAATFRVVASIADVQQQTLMSQVQNARKSALLIPELPLVEKHYFELSGAELELLGYQLNYLGDQGTLVQRV